jgi:hypothetical protein
MGTKNRQRRREKQRQRQQRHRQRDWVGAQTRASAGSRGTTSDLIDHYILGAADCDCAHAGHRETVLSVLVAGQPLVGGRARVADRLSVLLTQGIAVALNS